MMMNINAVMNKNIPTQQALGLKRDNSYGYPTVVNHSQKVYEQHTNNLNNSSNLINKVKNIISDENTKNRNDIINHLDNNIQQIKNDLLKSYSNENETNNNKFTLINTLIDTKLEEQKKELTSYCINEITNIDTLIDTKLEEQKKELTSYCINEITNIDTLIDTKLEEQKKELTTYCINQITNIKNNFINEILSNIKHEFLIQIKNEIANQLKDINLNKLTVSSTNIDIDKKYLTESNSKLYNHNIVKEDLITPENNNENNEESKRNIVITKEMFMIPHIFNSDLKHANKIVDNNIIQDEEYDKTSIAINNSDDKTSIAINNSNDKTSIAINNSDDKRNTSNIFSSYNKKKKKNN